MSCVTSSANIGLWVGQLLQWWHGLKGIKTFCWVKDICHHIALCEFRETCSLVPYFRYCQLVLRDVCWLIMLIAVRWYMWCVSRHFVVVCLHTNGHLLSAAAQASCRTCSSRGCICMLIGCKHSVRLLEVHLASYVVHTLVLNFQQLLACYIPWWRGRDFASSYFSVFVSALQWTKSTSASGGQVECMVLWGSECSGEIMFSTICSVHGY